MGHIIPLLLPLAFVALVANDLRERWDMWNASHPPIAPEFGDDEAE